MQIQSGLSHAVDAGHASPSGKQRAGEAALELVEICNTMTYDGRILDESIAELRDWARHYSDLEQVPHCGPTGGPQSGAGFYGEAF